MVGKKRGVKIAKYYKYILWHSDYMAYFADITICYYKITSYN